MTTADLIKRFNDLEGRDEEENITTNVPDWWEGYVSALADHKIITEDVFDECIDYIKAHTEAH